METKFGIKFICTTFYLLPKGVEYLYDILEDEEKPYDLKIAEKTIYGFRCVQMTYKEEDKKHFKEIFDQARKIIRINVV